MIQCHLKTSEEIVRMLGRQELLELLVLASHCRQHLLVQRIQAVGFLSISDLRSQTCVYMTRREYRDHTVPSGLLHPCVYTVHHAHILLVYSITPHSTPASHSTPLHTPPLYSLGPALPPRYPLPDCTRCWYAGLVRPLQCCALVQGYGGGGGAIFVDEGTMTLSDCTFNGNTAVRNQ